MAKFKVHKKKLEINEQGVLVLVPGALEPVPDATFVALCGTAHRSLLPLVLDDDWRRVTCARCLKQKPALSWWERVLAFVGLTRRGE